MKDYLLRFPSKEEAVGFGLQSGFVALDEVGEPYTTLATHEYAVVIVGPWVKQIGADKQGDPIYESDGLHWVLFRDLAGLRVPDGADKYIFWTSDDRDYPEGCPQLGWAGDDGETGVRQLRRAAREAAAKEAEQVSIGQKGGK